MTLIRIMLTFAGAFFTFGDASAAVADLSTTLQQPSYETKTLLEPRGDWERVEIDEYSKQEVHDYYRDMEPWITWEFRFRNGRTHKALRIDVLDKPQLLEAIHAVPVLPINGMSPLYSFRMELSRLQFDKSLNTAYVIHYKLPKDQNWYDSVPPAERQLKIMQETVTLVQVPQNCDVSVSGTLSLHFDANGKLEFTHAPDNDTPVSRQLGDGSVRDISLNILQTQFITKVTRTQLDVRETLKSNAEHIESLTAELDSLKLQRDSLKQQLDYLKQQRAADAHNSPLMHALAGAHRELRAAKQDAADCKQQLIAESENLNAAQQNVVQLTSKLAVANTQLAIETQTSNGLNTQLKTEKGKVAAETQMSKRLNVQLTTEKDNVAAEMLKSSVLTQTLATANQQLAAKHKELMTETQTSKNVREILKSNAEHIESLTAELDSLKQQRAANAHNSPLMHALAAARRELSAAKQDAADFKQQLTTEKGKVVAETQTSKSLNVQLTTEKGKVAAETQMSKRLNVQLTTEKVKVAAEMSKSSALTQTLATVNQQLAAETAVGRALSAQLSTEKQNSASSKQQLAAEKQTTSELKLERSELVEALATEKESTAALAVDLQSEAQSRGEAEKATRFWFVAATVSGSALLLAAICALICVKLRKMSAQNAIASQSEGLPEKEGNAEECTVPSALVGGCRAERTQSEVVRQSIINHATDDELFPRRRAVQLLECEDGDSEEMYESGPVSDTCVSTWTPAGEI